MVRREGARAGERIYVSGTIGDAAAGLMLRSQKEPGLSMDRDGRAFLLDRYLHPQPRLALAPILRAHASAAMDISDGLVGDLTKMLRVSGVSAAIDLSRIPLSNAARVAVEAEAKLYERLLTGGDDYEILCTVPPHESASFEGAAKKARIDVTAIGVVEAGSDAPCFRGKDGTKRHFARGSFSHF
jgi:thiamine-monophosphate kinase